MTDDGPELENQWDVPNVIGLPLSSPPLADDQSLENISEERKKSSGSSKWVLTRQLVLITLLTSSGSSLQYGYNLWVASHPSTLIQNFYNKTYHRRNQDYITETKLDFLYTFTIAVYSFGGLIGSLLVSILVDRFGRKGSLVISNFMAIISAGLMGCSVVIHAYEYTIFTRLVTGICSGLFSCIVPLYLGELSPKNMRGSIMTVPMIFVAVGVMIAQILSLQEFLGTEKGWPLLLSFTGLLAVFQVIILPSFPESPRFLLIQRNDEEKSRQVLQRLRCQDDVESEIDELYQENISVKAEKGMNGLKLLCQESLRWQIISVVILISGQQLTGVNAVFYYSDKIYANLKVRKQEARYISVMSNIFIIISLMIVVYIIDYVGRRILLLTGFGICSLFCVLLTMTLELQTTMPWMTYVTTAFFILLLFGHILGPGPVPNVIVLELFLQPSRSIAFALGGFVHWFLHFIMGMVFIQIESRIGSYSFLLFWPLCIFSFVYIFSIIPETSGKTFLEVKRYMLAMSKKVRAQVLVPVRGSSTIRQGRDRRRSTRPSIKRDSVKRDSVKRDSLKRDSVKRDSVKRDSLKRDSVRRGSAKRDSMKRKESIKKKRRPTIAP